jgi:hypothetical protein
MSPGPRGLRRLNLLPNNKFNRVKAYYSLSDRCLRGFFYEENRIIPFKNEVRARR